MEQLSQKPYNEGFSGGTAAFSAARHTERADRRPERHAGYELARAYVPLQQAREYYCPERSLAEGTVYPELARPYAPGN
ncbi:MAG: spore coat associated protein CotJA [Clostridiales bacterium]|jgi:hypothetical protein|nr:spore coat associated protein CotJA [Clostridiales bacterium]